MSKDKKTVAAEPTELGPPGMPSRPKGPEPFVDPGPQVGQTAPLPNGTPEAAPKAPPVRRTWSTPLQGMARIEAVMNDLTEKQQAVVFAWFAATYGPSGGALTMTTEAKP